MSGTPQSASLTLSKKDFKKLKTGAAQSALRIQGPGELYQIDVEFNDPTLEIWANIDAQDLPKASPFRIDRMGFREPRGRGWWVGEFADVPKIYTLSYTPYTPLTFQRMLEIKVRNPNKVSGAKITDSYVMYYVHDPTPELREDGAPQPRISEGDI
jgi:hypothetical protein